MLFCIHLLSHEMQRNEREGEKGMSVRETERRRFGSGGSRVVERSLTHGMLAVRAHPRGPWAADYSSSCLF